MKKQHKPDQFEKDIIAFLERRKGETVSDELLEAFALFFWRKRVAFELEIMRTMVSR